MRPRQLVFASYQEFDLSAKKSGYEKALGMDTVRQKQVKDRLFTVTFFMPTGTATVSMAKINVENFQKI